jgi:hypothetical protein
MYQVIGKTFCLGNDHLTWMGGYGFFLKKYYDLEGKEIK